MTKKFAGAKPPLVGISPISSREAIFNYNFKRAMFDYFLGLARAGEQGRGFAVVADEVRKLAEQSKSAVEEINSNLIEFVKAINTLVNKIGDQYDILQNETKGLEEVRDISYEATMSVRTVSTSMINTINDLDREAKTIANIYETIESLAAIAEENSASSEEVSASVGSYTNEIKKLIDSIYEFKKITSSFKNDLKKYKI